jgi:L-fuconolactonase
VTGRVDAHHHLWDLSVRDQPWTADLPVLRRSFSLDDLRPSLARAGVGATVLVQTVAVAGETPEMLTIARDNAEVAGVVGWVDLTAPDVADRLAELRESPGGDRLVGVRHLVQSEPDPRWLLRPAVRRGLLAVAAAGLAYDLLVIPPQLDAAVAVVRQVPGLRFVLDHGGKPYIAAGELDPWREQIRALASVDSVAVKLSGLVTEAAADWTPADLAPYADHLLACFGPSRVMIGSDWPVCLLRADYQTVLSVTDGLVDGLSPAELAEVRGGTCRRWYRLPGTA